MISELLLERFSPREFGDKAVSQSTLEELFKSASTVASCYNEQPWRFALALEGTELFNTLVNDVLMEGNQGWAKTASALVVNIANTQFERNGKENGLAAYDLGQAVSAFAIAAHEKGIAVHQMGGFFPDKASSVLELADNLQPISVMAVGYYKNNDFSESKTAKEENRKGLGEILLG